MKKVCLVLMAVIFSASFLNAQEENEGGGMGMWLGGTVGFVGDNYTIGPSWGMMIGEVMGVGLNTMFSGGGNTDSWELEPYFRYYHGITDNFKFFGDAAISFGGTTTETGGTEVKSSSFGINVRPGIQYWITPRWSLASTIGEIGYNQTKVEDQDADGDFGLTIDFASINFSFFWHF